MERVDHAGVHLLTREGCRLPGGGGAIPAPPPRFMSQADWRPVDDWSVAVVGTRSPTSYGRERCADSWASWLGRASRLSAAWR